jgi:hypothetical protein
MGIGMGRVLYQPMPVNPPGESLRQAVKWISDQRQARPDANLAKLLDEAGLRFDLSPAEQEWLAATFLRKDGSS